MRSSDPISDVQSRFALDAPHGLLAPSDDEPSGPNLRPYGLRFARAFGSGSTVARVPAYRYCPERQIAVVADGRGLPAFRHTNPKTVETTGTPDGGRPGGEQSRTDWQKG